MPDWKRTKPQGSRAYLPAADPEAAATLTQLQLFMQSHEDAAAHQRAVKMDPCKQGRFASAYFAQALGHGMRGGLGFGLSKFTVTKPPRALTCEEQRYFVPTAEAGEGLLPDDPPFRLRSCIHNRRTGQCWLELTVSRRPDGKLTWPALHLTTDEGSIGSPMIYWLLHETPHSCDKKH